MGVGAPFVLSLFLFFSSSPPLFPPAPQVSYFVDEHKTGSASCGILPWACFGDAVTSFVGYYAAAQEAGFKFVPKTFPLCNKTQHRPIDNLIDRFFLYVPRHGSPTTKETIQPNNKAPENSMVWLAFFFWTTVRTERPHWYPLSWQN